MQTVDCCSNDYVTRCHLASCVSRLPPLASCSIDSNIVAVQLVEYILLTEYYESNREYQKL